MQQMPRLRPWTRAYPLAILGSTVTIFGVAGNSNVVDTSSGDATAGDMLSGKKAWVDGSEVTGNIQENGAGGTITPGTSDQTVASGYLSSANTVSGDADLVGTNIKCGVTIFGVTGTLLPSCVAKTGQTTSYSAGDDGYYQKGCDPAVSPSGGSDFGNYSRTSLLCSVGFTDNGNGTVTDNLTGLIWLKNAECFELGPGRVP